MHVDAGYAIVDTVCGDTFVKTCKMKKLVPFAIVAAGCVPSVSAAADVITELPAGRGVDYYADLRNEDNLYGFMGDYHSVHKIVFTEDGKVYIPNLLMRNTMPAYVEGVLDEAAGVVTVAAGQAVYVSPNISDVARLYMLDKSGVAGDVATKQFHAEPLRFKMGDDGALTLISSEEFPMFGIASESDPGVVYGIGADLRFVTTASVADKIKYYELKYVNDGNETSYSTTISGYTEGDDEWFKGFDPRYPDAWIKGTYVGEELRAASFQVVSFSMSDIPTIMAASTREIGESGSYEYTHYNFMPIAADRGAGTFSACKDGMFMTNVCTWGGDTPEVYQVYRDVSLSEIQLEASVPSDPLFLNYVANATSDGETEFKFRPGATGVGGDALLKDAMSLRYYVNGEPYVFRKSLYTRQQWDMELIPYTYQDNGAFVGHSDGETHYVYFLDLPADLKTIGVEVVYTMGGETNVSRRLVYDVVTGRTDYAGLADVAAGARDVESVEMFDLTGRRLSEVDAHKGVVIKRVRYSDGTMETVKEIVR